MLRCKTIKTSVLHVNNDGFTSPLIIPTLEKRAPGPLSWLRDLALLTNYPSHSTRLRHTVVTLTFDHTAVSALPLSQDFTACNMVFLRPKWTLNYLSVWSIQWKVLRLLVKAFQFFWKVRPWLYTTDLTTVEQRWANISFVLPFNFMS